MRRRVAALAALAAMGLGAGCLQDTGGADEERPPVVHTVTIEASAFQPAVVTARPGDRVTWVNKDFFPHTTTANGTFDSGPLQPGASWTFTVAAVGTTDYICLLHPSMTGTLRVEE